MFTVSVCPTGEQNLDGRVLNITMFTLQLCQLVFELLWKCQPSRGAKVTDIITEENDKALQLRLVQ